MAKKVKEPERPPLEVGDEVVLILTKVTGTRSKSGDRRTVEGCARGHISACLPESLYRIKVLLASPAYFVGKEVEYPRKSLYAVKSREERLAFDEIVNFLWKPRER